MAEVRVKENESLDSALRRFKKQCARSGVLSELRKREHYEKPSVKRKKPAVSGYPVPRGFQFPGLIPKNHHTGIKYKYLFLRVLTYGQFCDIIYSEDHIL